MSSTTNLPFAEFGRRQTAQNSSHGDRVAAVAAMSAHPAMAEALRIFFAGLVDAAQGNRLLGLIVSDRARMIMTLLALYLDASYDGRDPRSGLTVNRFKALCARAGRSSPGRAGAMLGLMRFAGYLEPANRTVRGQPLRLVPTEKLIAPQRARLRCALTAIAKLRPEGAIGLARLDDPVFFRTLILCCGDQILTREPMIEHGPSLSFFADRKAGLTMLMALMLSARPDDHMPPTGPMAVPIKQLTQRFAVSRSQVRDMLREGVAVGLLVPTGPSESAYELTPGLRADAVGFVAASFLVIADAVAQAQNELAVSAQRIEGVA